jgi:DNA-binding NarL/FixJ family response regulator
MSPIPKALRPHLRDGARARLRGSLDLDHASIPVDLKLRLRVEDSRRVSVDLTLPDDDPQDAGPAARLTPRERKVVSLIGMGRSTDEIARELYITPATVRTHVRNAMAKLKVHTRAQLVARILAGPNGHNGEPPADEAA